MHDTNPNTPTCPQCRLEARRKARFRLLAERQISISRRRRTGARQTPFDTDMMTLLTAAFRDTLNAAQ